LIASDAYSAQGVAFSGSAVVSLHGSPNLVLGDQFVRSFTNFSIDVLDPSTTDFNILSFDYIGPLRLSILGVKGASPDVLIDAPAATGWKTYTAPALDLDIYGLIDAITIGVNTQSVEASFGFGIDNLRLSVQGGGSVTPPPIGVPEPAGYGLAGLALLAAGLASRRRRQG
jgi:MYXO-CTERM domain-containing protein